MFPPPTPGVFFGGGYCFFSYTLCNIFLDICTLCKYNPAMATRIRDIVAELIKAGFRQIPGGKGSHRKFKHDPSGVIAVVCHKDGDDAPVYLCKQIRAKISKATGKGE